MLCLFFNGSLRPVPGKWVKLDLLIVQHPMMHLTGLSSSQVNPHYRRVYPILHPCYLQANACIDIALRRRERGDGYPEHHVIGIGYIGAIHRFHCNIIGAGYELCFVDVQAHVFDVFS